MLRFTATGAPDASSFSFDFSPVHNGMINLGTAGKKFSSLFISKNIQIRNDDITVASNAASSKQIYFMDQNNVSIGTVQAGTDQYANNLTLNVRAKNNQSRNLCLLASGQSDTAAGSETFIFGPYVNDSGKFDLGRSNATWNNLFLSGKINGLTLPTGTHTLATTDDILYLTSAPSFANTTGQVKIVVLSSEPSSKKNGYIYLITG